MRPSRLAACLIITLVSCAEPEPVVEDPAVRSPDDSAVRSLVDAERAFARDAQERTVGDAFMAALADDGILFRPDAVPGREHTRSNPPPADLHLDWEPEYAEVSAAGDLGFTTGPWESGRRGEPPAGFGRFLSVWHRSPDGWRVLIDHGIAHAGPRPDVTIAMRSGTGAGAGSPEPADAALDAALSRGDAEAWAVLAEDARVLRDGSLPATGAAAAELARGTRTARFARAGGGVAASGDLAWSHGTWRGPREHGHYVRIWRSEGGVWRLLVDLTTG